MNLSQTGYAGRLAAPRWTVPPRWVVLAAAVQVQLALGAIYDWSLFGAALGPQGSSILRLTSYESLAPFEVALGILFVGSFVGGRIQDRRGPRTVTLVGGALYSSGIGIASLARQPGQFWLLVIGYGVLGGFGVGMAYITPLATLQKWFPDKRTLAASVSVAGFGFGGTITALVAGPLISLHRDAPAEAFATLAVVYAVLTIAGGLCLRDPPGATQGGLGRVTLDNVSADVTVFADSTRGASLRAALASSRWWLLTITLTGNVVVSVGFISSMTTTASTISAMPNSLDSLLVSLVAISNGVGRVAWAAVAARLLRRPAGSTYRSQAGHTDVLIIILGVQAFALVSLLFISDRWSFIAASCVIGLCCGGGFGVMPGAASHYFGIVNAGAIYGLMLIGWSVGGVLGPPLFTLMSSPSTQHQFRWACLIFACISYSCIAFPLVIRPHSGSEPTASTDSSPTNQMRFTHD